MTDTAPATFEPDWSRIAAEFWRGFSVNDMNRLRQAVTEYERQRTAAGLVDVQRNEYDALMHVASLASEHAIVGEPGTAIDDACEALEAIRNRRTG